MRNLAVVDVVHQDEAVPCISQTFPCISIDSDNECAYCSTDNGIVVLDIRSGDVVRSLDLFAKGLLAEGDSVVDLHYRLDDMSLCVALSKGDLLSWPSGSDVECVGSIGEGISTMGWSPDGELVALFTSGNNTEPARIYLLVCHGSELEPLTDFLFSTSDFGEAEFVTVGWGKKETQFHGSEGKEAATKKEAVQFGVRSTDDGKPRIRWIGDGRFFAVSAIDPTVGTRKIRVWTRDGALHSTSELLTGLEQALDWRPSGNLIASSQTHKNKHQIIFFERNGLRHGEFTLPYSIDAVKVQEVLWNNESNVLCVWLEDLSISKTCVQFWTMNNYHWYLKQNLEFITDVQRPTSVLWDVIDSSVLYILSKNGSLTIYTIDWVTNSNTFTGSDHEVAVVDGDKLLMTPFRTMVVPPPMCAYSLSFSSHIRSVCFCQSSNQMAVYLTSGEIVIYPLTSGFANHKEAVKGLSLEAAGGPGFAIKSAFPDQFSSYALPETLQKSLHSLRHMNWLSSDRLCFVRSNSSGANVLTVMAMESETSCMRIIDEMSVGHVRTTCCGNDQLVLQYNDGSVWIYKNNECVKYTTNGSALMFPVPCQLIELYSFAGQEVVVGLSSRYRLFVNTHEISTNCTSFTLHEDFLLITSHNHTIRCINRATPLSELAGLSDGKAHIFDEMVRRVERGSQIIACVSDDTKVILQMPRGNLECIHPRALVLSTVRKLLDRLKYKQAFMLMHRHRINMNLICDHDRAAFLDNIKLFVEQIKSVAHINQFITGLHEEDVTYTMYTGFYTQKTEPVSGGICKVDSVCDALIAALQTIDSSKYLLSILTAHVRKTEPQLETALSVIKALQETDKAQAEDSLKYLMFLVDVNELFDVALGMYDFDLVLMVAEKSQKDPKEYLMFLNEVRKLETNYQRFTIDKHLKRYVKALSHISKCVPDKFTELISLVKEQKLYTEALNILSHGSQAREDVIMAFGDYLNEKKRYEEAGLLYAQADQPKLAVDCFTECGNWQQAIICIEKLSLHSNERLQKITKLSEKLRTKRMYGEDATLLEVYAGQPEEAITTLITGCLWDESLRLIHKYSRHDFIETDWKPALEESRQQVLSNIQNDIKDLKAYRDRFLVVLQANKSKAELIGEEYRDVDADMYSDTSSMTGTSVVSSSHSRSTGRTSKNQRKAQRKKWSLNEGSKFEDLALLDEMKKLVARIDSIRDDVRALLLALVKVAQLEKAAELQATFSDALSEIIILVPEVWSAEVTNSSAQLTGEHSTVNSILESMAKLSVGPAANPNATLAEIEVKRSPIVSTDSTWKLMMLSKLS